MKKKKKKQQAHRYVRVLFKVDLVKSCKVVDAFIYLFIFGKEIIVSVVSGNWSPRQELHGRIT